MTFSDVLAKLKIYGPKKFVGFAFSELWNRVYMQTIRKSYSQNGEDLVIDQLLSYKTIGFYVDVGAYDPYRFSNTKRFYDRGWNGINIEPSPENYEEFLKVRPRDINLNIGIGETKSRMIFYKMFPDTLSTFSKENMNTYVKEGYKLVEKLEIQIDTLAGVLKEHAEDKIVDFLTVDTEGLDLTVLKSNDWKNSHPEVICVENSHADMRELESFLNSVGYQKFFDNKMNCIFKFME